MDTEIEKIILKPGYLKIVLYKPNNQNIGINNETDISPAVNT